MVFEIIRAVTKGDLDVLIRILEKDKIRFVGYARYAFSKAVTYGHLHICKWFLTLPDKYGIKPNSSSLIIAFTEGHLEVCKWLFSLPEEKYTINFPETLPGTYDDVSCYDRYRSEEIDGYFRETMENGHWDICRWALKLPRERSKLNSVGKYGISFKYAYEEDHLDICEGIFKSSEALEFLMYLDEAEHEAEIRYRDHFLEIILEKKDYPFLKKLLKYYKTIDWDNSPWDFCKWLLEKHRDKP